MRSTSGPGALHLINGLYNAQKEDAAVVAITVTSQVPRAELGSDYHKEVNLTKVFEDVCAYQAIIETPEQVPRMIEIAVQKALDERAVVRVELPMDVIDLEVPSLHYNHLGSSFTMVNGDWWRSCYHLPDRWALVPYLGFQCHLVVLP